MIDADRAQAEKEYAAAKSTTESSAKMAILTLKTATELQTWTDISDTIANPLIGHLMAVRTLADLYAAAVIQIAVLQKQAAP